MSNVKDLVAIEALCAIGDILEPDKIDHEDDEGWKRCMNNFKSRDMYENRVHDFLSYHPMNK